MHGIHGAEKRTVPYTWHAVSADDNFSKIVYPGVLARCEQCHVPGSYDFTNTASADAAGIGPDGTNKREFRYITGNVTASVSKAPDAWLAAGNYVPGFSYSAATGITTIASDTNLLLSPTVSACVGCHDSALAISHIQGQRRPVL